MLTSEQLKTLKQVNVSVDAEKTKERIKFDFSNSTNKEKREIVELSGQKRASFYRAYDKGAVNARLVLAIAQVTNVSPYYYTGEEDERERYSETLAINFLNDKGYHLLAAELSAAEEKPKRARKQKAETDEESMFNSSYFNDDDEDDDFDDEEGFDEELDEDEIQFELIFSDTERVQDVLESLTEDDAILLLRALIRRAEAGGEAEGFLEVVKRCLLT
ncbi:MAG: hypothetical protein LBS19_16325 [Clostridiales bacterium]|jgi:hypothetical protein|nr:hypothetical protein [Clostridiales bacterium]